MNATQYVTPQNNYVIVEQTKLKKSVSESGLIINELVKYNETLVGKVISISNDPSHKFTVQVGDTVYFTEVGLESRILLDGKEYIVIPETEILGYIRD